MYFKGEKRPSKWVQLLLTYFSVMCNNLSDYHCDIPFLRPELTWHFSRIIFGFMSFEMMATILFSRCSSIYKLGINYNGHRSIKHIVNPHWLPAYINLSHNFFHLKKLQINPLWMGQSSSLHWWGRRIRNNHKLWKLSVA